MRGEALIVEAAAADPSRRGAAPGRPWMPEALLGAALLVNVLVAFVARCFPFEDSLNHLARYVLMERILFGTPPDYVAFLPLPTPYVGLDLLGAGMVHLVGPAATLRVFGLLALCAPALGMYVLLRAVAPERRGWALAGALLGFNSYLLAGFISYVIGIGMAFAWLGLWWPRRATASWLTRLALAAGASLIFLVHLAPVMLLLVVVGLDTLLTLLHRKTVGTRVTKAVLVTALAVLAGVVLMYVLYRVTLPPPHIKDPWHFRGLPSKLKKLVTPFYSLSVPQVAVLLLGFVCTGLAYLRATRGLRRLETFTISAVTLLVIYFVFPPGRGETIGGFDVRWLLPAVLLGFCASGAAPVRGRVRGRVRRAEAWLWVPFSASVVHGLVMVPHLARVDRDLRAYDTVLAALPPNGRLLPLVADSARHGRPLVLRSYGHWYMIRQGGRVPWMFVAEGFSEDAKPNEHFAHFREPRRLYVPTERWKRAETFAIRRTREGHWYDIIFENGWPEYQNGDRDRIAREYDFVLVAGRDPAVRALVPDGATLLREVDGIAVYATGRGTARTPLSRWGRRHRPNS
jgi:hypothetical protein